MHRTHKVIFCLILLLFISNQVMVSNLHADKGKSEKFEDEIKKKSSDDNDNSSNSWDDDEDDDDILGNCISEMFGKIFINSMAELFIGTRELHEDYDRFFWESNYSEFPYKYNNQGLYSKQGDSNWKSETAFNYFINSSDFTAKEIHTRLSFTPFLFLGFNSAFFTEELDTSNDHMQILDFNLNYMRFRNPYFNWYWGFNYKFFKRSSTFNGAGLNTGCEIYPYKPLSIKIRTNVAWLNGNPVSEFNTSLNFHYNRFKLSAGYQNFKAGSETIDGFVSGVGVFF